MGNGHITVFPRNRIIRFVHKIKSSVYVGFKIIDDDGTVDIEFFPFIRCGISQGHISQMFIGIISALGIDFIYGETAHNVFLHPFPYGFFHKNSFFLADLAGRRSKILIFFTFIGKAIKGNILKNIKIINLYYDKSIGQCVLFNADRPAQRGIEHGYDVRILETVFRNRTDMVFSVG